jgi:2-octaprenylphenol hydroxylase
LTDKTEEMLVDVVVAGGGMVGAALACALAQNDVRVALVEKYRPSQDWPQDEVDLRVSALTRASQNLLQNLGAWQEMMTMRVSPYRHMHVWDAGGRGSIQFDAADIGEPDLGHIVENRVIQLGLWRCLERLGNLQIHSPDAVSDMRTSEAGVVVKLEGGAEIRAQLLVGAEGAGSPVREMAGINSSGWAYDQHAIVATIWPRHHHGEVARQRFMPNGPLAFLPIVDGRCSIVWSTSPPEAERLMALDDKAFCRELTQASDQMLGEIIRVGPRGAFPLRLRNADQYVQPGLALVGDAAHGIHPLAGQGVNLGFLDAATLVNVLLEARRDGRALGGMAVLRRYERARKGNNVAMLGAMDFFKRLFSNTNPLLGLVRNLGLTLADLSGPAKQLTIRRALGLVGELPPLCRRRYPSE